MSVATNMLSRRVRTAHPELRTGGELAEIHRARGPLPEARNVTALELFAETLSNRFLPELPTIQRPSGRWTSDRATIARYLKSIDLLDRHADSFRRFLDTLIRSITRLHVPRHERTYGHEETIDELRNLVRDKLRYALALPPSAVTADLVAEGSAELQGALAADLRSRSALLARHVCRVLVDGVRGGVLGTVTWLNRGACRFVHHRLNIHLQESIVAETALGEASVCERYRHEIARHEVHLMNAVQFRGIPIWMRIPEEFHEALGALPGYLLPYVCTLDGRLIRERVVAWDIMETQSETKIEIPIARPDPDPAITIGNIVLMGWTPRDFTSRRGAARRALAGLWRAVDYVQANSESVGEPGEEGAP